MVFTTTGALPTGITLTAAGILSGTPAAATAGTYAITIAASNGVGGPATQVFRLTVPSALHWLGSPGVGGNLWSVAANWQENIVPSSGDTVLFDTNSAGFSATANGFNPINDIVGLTNLAIAINDASTAGDFQLGGNAVSVAASGIVSNVSIGFGAWQYRSRRRT